MGNITSLFRGSTERDSADIFPLHFNGGHTLLHDFWYCFLRISIHDRTIQSANMSAHGQLATTDTFQFYSSDKHTGQRYLVPQIFLVPTVASERNLSDRTYSNGIRVTYQNKMDAVDIPSERVPGGLKQCEQILKRAKELKKAEPVVAYWCKLEHACACRCTC